jgi:hypothetical protein
MVDILVYLTYMFRLDIQQQTYVFTVHTLVVWTYVDRLLGLDWTSISRHKCLRLTS